MIIGADDGRIQQSEIENSAAELDWEGQKGWWSVRHGW